MPDRPARILVVEDEAHLAEGIVLNLEAEGYAVEHRADGLEALAAARAGAHDLLLLDVMLPSLTGFEICEELRAEGCHTPILFLTARGRHEDRVLGLDLGGDDYLAKPFRLEELLSRVRAQLRRRRWQAPAAPQGAPCGIGPRTVDLRTGYGDGPEGPFRLTDKETGILRVLVEHAGQAVSRDALIERCWGADEMPTRRTIDNFVLRLRKRFEDDPKFPRHLITVFGQGYRFTP